MGLFGAELGAEPRAVFAKAGDEELTLDLLPDPLLDFGEVLGGHDSVHVLRLEDLLPRVPDHLREPLVAVDDGALVVDQDPLERGGLEQLQPLRHLSRFLLFAEA
jgi:hypothetical protein